MNLRQFFANTITDRPEIVQFSKDRKFELAWIIDRISKPPEDEAIANYLATESFQLLTVEYVWHADDDQQRFVLTIFFDQSCMLKDAHMFVELSLAQFYDYRDLLALLATFDAQVIGKAYLLQTPLEDIKLGVFNHWFSVGPVDLWQQGEPYSPEEVVAKIKAKPEVWRSKLNYQALFFRFNFAKNVSGPFYGLKTPCCHKVGDYWEIYFELVNYWLQQVLLLQK